MCVGNILYVWLLEKGPTVYRKCLSLHSMSSNQFWALSTKEFTEFTFYRFPGCLVKPTMIFINIVQKNNKNNF